MTDSTNTTRDQLKKLGLFGLLSCWNSVRDKEWLPELIAIEERERQRRSLERRLRNAKLGQFKPMADFDWSWPKQIDRLAVEDVLNLDFLAQGLNIILIGPNGVGKTAILKNMAHGAVVTGHTVRFVTAAEMLSDLAAQDSSAALSRRMRRYTSPALLCIDEVGYLSYDSRYGDLLFGVVTARYEARRPIGMTTNKIFEEWNQVFPEAACVVTLIDRLLHRAEVIRIAGESYRNKEAEEAEAARKLRRRKKKSR